jgi:hypothetical protein
MRGKESNVDNRQGKEQHNSPDAATSSTKRDPLPKKTAPEISGAVFH